MRFCFSAGGSISSHPDTQGSGCESVLDPKCQHGICGEELLTYGITSQAFNKMSFVQTTEDPLFQCTYPFFTPCLLLSIV